MQSPSIFVNPNTGVFLSPAAQRNNINPLLCSAPLSSLSPLQFLPFPITQEPPLILVFSIKKGGKSPRAGLGEGWWVHSETHKNLISLFCHAETTPGSLTHQSFCTARKDGDWDKDLEMAKIWDTSLSLAAQLPGWLMAGEQILVGILCSRDLLGVNKRRQISLLPPHESSGYCRDWAIPCP